MGKIRVAALGDESEQEQKRRADARRQTKKSKKAKVEGVGLKGGERVAVVEGESINPEFKKLVDEVESGEPVTEGGKKPSKKKRERVRSKRYQEVLKMVDKSKEYNLNDAVELVKKTSTTKFDGTVELHINLNPMVLGEKKDVRGQVTLPHGTGKKINVVIADDAIIAQVEKGVIDFDILVAHPSMMAKLAKVARVLGPKGLMPNPKNGTVSPDPEKRVKELSQGQVNYKNEPDQPIVHMIVGKVSFDDIKIKENITAVFDSIGKNKISRVTLSSTMGPGVKVAVA